MLSHEEAIEVPITDLIRQQTKRQIRRTNDKIKTRLMMSLKHPDSCTCTAQELEIPEIEEFPILSGSSADFGMCKRGGKTALFSTVPKFEDFKNPSEYAYRKEKLEEYGIDDQASKQRGRSPTVRT